MRRSSKTTIGGTVMVKILTRSAVAPAPARAIVFIGLEFVDQAPALGTASLYSVRFFQLGVDGNNRTTRTVVANVDTTDTFLDIPAGILIPGQTYFFLVSATTTGNIDAPARGRLPDAFTPVASAQFTVGIGTDPVPPPDAGTDPPDAFITVDTPPGSVCLQRRTPV